VPSSVAGLRYLLLAEWAPQNPLRVSVVSFVRSSTAFCACTEEQPAMTVLEQCKYPMNRLAVVSFNQASGDTSSCRPTSGMAREAMRVRVVMHRDDEAWCFRC
jgi:hypothetical protein